MISPMLPQASRNATLLVRWQNSAFRSGSELNSTRFIVARGIAPLSETSRERGNSWEFPILVKYKLPVPIARPLVEVGYAPRLINGSIESNGVTVNLLTGAQTFQRSRMNTNWDSSQGIVAGGGIQLGLGRLRLSPEVRYTHWNNAAIHVYYTSGVAFQSTQDQVDLLVGIGWNTRLLGR